MEKIVLVAFPAILLGALVGFAIHVLGQPKRDVVTYDVQRLGHLHSPAATCQLRPFAPCAAGSRVSIRLPQVYRERDDGREDEQVYTLNVAIAEALLLERDVPIEPVDETPFGVDLDLDGFPSRTDHVAFDPRIEMSWVGRARLLGSKKAPLVPGRLPPGAELSCETSGVAP